MATSPNKQADDKLTTDCKSRMKRLKSSILSSLMPELIITSQSLLLHTLSNYLKLIIWQSADIVTLHMTKN